MSLRDQRSRPAKVRTHFYFSHARGDAIRTVAVRPLVLWSLAAFAALTLVWAGLTTVYLVFHDDMLAALAAREAEQQYAYEDRIAEARADLDRVAGRQLLDQSSFEGKLHELLSRQARLEQRGAIVAALADQTTRSLAAAEPPAHASSVAGAKPAGSALSAIGAASPLAPTDSVIGPAARAFAPVAPIAPTIAAGPQKPRPIDDPRAQPTLGPQAAAERGVGADLLAAADNPDLDAAARLSLISVSLDRTERRQATAVGEIAADARAGAAKLSAVVTRAGLAADTLVAPAAKGGVGGPFIPLSVDPAAPAFDKALASAARDVAAADRLSRLLPILPVRAPLIGEAAVSSPFGYRTDPFLGRPELHPGVDLVQDYGSEIHATAGGRVTHAGPMGGYGDMVEIDHGNGLVTRYGHMSEILVAEGQEVTAGALLGRLGSTGRSTGPHLHYEVRVDGEPVDPERFLAAGAPLFGTPL